MIITNRKGKEVYNGTTPATLQLKSGSGFFAQESYTVTLSMNGYETKKVNLECKVNGWYFGNLLLGGVIGMLIVDPATGAMYKLESPDVNEDLSKPASGSSLTIMNKKEIPQDWAARLVRIN